MTQGITGRPALHLPRIIGFLEANDPDHLGVHVSLIAPALGITRAQVTAALGNHLHSAGPKALVARTKVGHYRLTSAAERARKAGRVATAKFKAARKAAKTETRVVTVGEAALNDQLKAKDGWVAPAALDIPTMNIKRGGIEFPLPIEAGLSMLDAVVAHVSKRYDSAGEMQDVYFVWRGKMWKAYEI